MSKKQAKPSITVGDVVGMVMVVAVVVTVAVACMGVMAAYLGSAYGGNAAKPVATDAD